MPGNTRIELTNTYNNANRAYTIYIGQNSRSDPSTFAPILEGETATGASSNSNSGSSGNAYGSYTSGVPAGEYRAYRWRLDQTLLGHAKGGYFRLLALLFGAHDGKRIKPRVQAELTTLWEGAQITAGTVDLLDLGNVRLPPYILVGAGTFYPLYLDIMLKTSVASETLALDYLMMMPAERLRRLQPNGYGMGYGVRLVDDGINSLVYTDGWSDAGKFGQYIGYGDAIRLEPGKNQRLYFCWTGWTGTVATMTMTVKLYYRPRKR